jgi:hypothetical protein
MGRSAGRIAATYRADSQAKTIPTVAIAIMVDVIIPVTPYLSRNSFAVAVTNPTSGEMFLEFFMVPPPIFKTTPGGLYSVFPRAGYRHYPSRLAHENRKPRR